MNDRIKATWYDNRSLILKGVIGERIKRLVIQELETISRTIYTPHGRKSQEIRNKQDKVDVSDDLRQSTDTDALKKSSLPINRSINRSINDFGDTNSDCSTIKELEDFIDQSFLDTHKSTLSKDSFSQIQTTDCPTPAASKQ